MKRALYALIAVATIGIATLNVSCKKEATDEFEVPSDSILIEMNMPLGAEGTTSFVSHNIASISAVSEPKGWEVTKIDMYRKEITVRSPKSFDDGEVKSGNITLTGYTALGADTSVTIYVAILENEDIDYSNAPANCYIANKPATRFLFNPYRGGGNGEVELNTDHIELIWESTEELINFIDMRDGKASLYLQPIKDDNGEFTDKVVTGNALIGAYDANDKLIWSWHIWVTNSDPTTDTIDLNGKVLMNINLGADCNSEGDHERVGDSYGMYYQWGRRTPIVGPNTWNFALNEDKLTYNSDGLIVRLQYTESTADSGTAKWANDNPTTMIVGNKDNAHDWLYEGHDELWSATEKSEHDPCPAGWRVPDSSIYEGLTISSVDDAMAWQEAQKMYGWHLVDEAGGSFFFTAQGRRNYLDGHLDIVNDDATRPIPWAGYYWTATTTDDGRASAMFFDLNSATRTWNGFEASRAMYRANALPIRCVRE